MDELELDLEGSEDINKTEQRIKNLSSKAKEAYNARDEAQAAALAAKTEAEAAAKERDFFKGFSAISARYPNATEYQDAILEKVNAGYSTEDAAVSVLNANGKLTQVEQQVQTVQASSAGGGSAATMIQDNTQKPVSEMSQTERRNALADPDRQAELEQILRGR